MINLPIQDKKLNISSPFGARGKGFHNGIDLAYSEGTPIYAMENGVVYNRTDQNGGLWQRLEVQDGYWDYVHMSKLAFPLWTSNLVRQGQLIGYVGNTGYSFGNHLHIGFFSKKEKKFIDPISRINGKNVEYINYYQKQKHMKEIANAINGLSDQINYLIQKAISENKKEIKFKDKNFRFKIGRKWENVVYRINNSKYKELIGATRGQIDVYVQDNVLYVEVLGRSGDLWQCYSEDGASFSKFKKLF